MTAAILVIGDVMIDVIVRPLGPLLRGTDQRAHIVTMPGGSGANQAVWMGAMGVPVKFAGRVGRTDVARYSALLSRHGARTHLAADEKLPTGTLISIVDADGERSFYTDRGANDALSSEDLHFSLLEGVMLVHISGYALISETSRTACLALIAEARDRNLQFSVDPGSTAFLREIGPANFLEWTRGANFVFPNGDEAELLTGAADPDVQIETLAAHYQTVVLKRGARGAMLGGKGRETLSLPADEARPIDTTGAGDAFLAGYIAGHLADKSDEECLAAAIAAGAKAVQHLGAQPPI